jgi:hypothetical protein
MIFGLRCVMRSVIVELDDHEMAQVEAVALARRVAPADLLKSEALRGLATQVERKFATDEASEQRRQARFAILMRSHGIFAGDEDKPKDGLVYQNELRAEWR